MGLGRSGRGFFTMVERWHENIEGGSLSRKFRSLVRWPVAWQEGEQSIECVITQWQQIYSFGPCQGGWKKRGKRGGAERCESSSILFSVRRED